MKKIYLFFEKSAMETRGRKKRTLLDAMRAKAWFAGIKNKSGLPTANKIDAEFHGPDSVEKKNFDRYERGEISPNETTLRLVEKKWPGTRFVYDDEPILSSGCFLIWKALSGTMDDLWDVVLAEFDPVFEKSRLFGFTQKHRIHRLLSYLLVEGDKLELDAGPLVADLNYEGMGAFDEPKSGYTSVDFVTSETSILIFKSPIDMRENRIDVKRDNPIATRWADGQLKIDVNSLAATIAIWRLSHFLGEGWYEMDTVIRGLTLVPGIKIQRDATGTPVGQIPVKNQQSAIDSVLGPYGIEQDFLVMLDDIWQKSVHKYAAVVHSIPPKKPWESRAAK